MYLHTRAVALLYKRNITLIAMQYGCISAHFDYYDVILIIKKKKHPLNILPNVKFVLFLCVFFFSLAGDNSF